MKYLVKIIGLLIIAAIVLGFPVAATLSFIYDWDLYLKILFTCLSGASLLTVMYQVGKDLP